MKSLKDLLNEKGIESLFLYIESLEDKVMFEFGQERDWLREEFFTDQKDLSDIKKQ